MFKQIEKYILKEMSEFQIPSLSIAIAKEQSIIWSKGFGLVNVEEQIPATHNTIYRVASMTKQVIATALLQWLEKGKFQFDDPVNNLLDKIKIRTEFKEQPTVWNLLTHTSGLPIHVPPIYYNRNEAISLEELISRYAEVILPPNKIWAYSNTAYNIIGYLVGLFAKQPYPIYVKENLFAPLEMNSSEFELTKSIENFVAKGYHWNQKLRTVEAVKPYIIGCIPEASSSSLFTTASDYAHFLIAHMNGGMYKRHRILKKETIEEMQKIQYAIKNSLDGMGLSWFINRHYGYKSICQHGSMPGVGTFGVIYPDQKLAIVILTNISGVSDWRRLFTGAILQMLFKNYQPFKPETIKLDTISDEWQKIAGIYGEQLQTLTINFENGYLIMQEGEEKMYLEKIDKGRYMIHGGANDGLELTFESDEQGRIKQLYLGTRIISRYIEEELPIDESIDLIGYWRGKYVNWLHPFILNLHIYNRKQATITDMVGNVIPLINFKADLGKVTGNFSCKILPEYIDWINANEIDVKLTLSAINNKLQGYLIERWATPVTFYRI